MYVDLQYAYAALCFSFGVFWLMFYIFSTNTRTKMLAVSIKRAPFGLVLDYIYTSDYWSPQSMLFVEIGDKMFMAESLLFAFFLSGIAAVAYRAIFPRKSESYKIDSDKALTSIGLTAGYCLAISASVILMKFGMNSIYSTALCYAMIGIVIVTRNPLLLPCCLFTSIFVCGLMFTIYLGGRLTVSNLEQILSSWWMLYDTNLDIRVCDIPVTELVWGLGYGFTAGARHNLPTF